MFCSGETASFLDRQLCPTLRSSSCWTVFRSFPFAHKGHSTCNVKNCDGRGHQSKALEIVTVNQNCRCLPFGGARCASAACALTRRAERKKKKRAGGQKQRQETDPLALPDGGELCCPSILQRGHPTEPPTPRATRRLWRYAKTLLH